MAGKINKSYSEQMEQTYLKSIRDIVTELPEFCSDYFRGIEIKTSPRTRLGYAYDLKLFFLFLINNIDEFNNISCMRQLDLDYMGRLNAVHVEKFLEYTSLYHNIDTGLELKNGEKGKSRKLSAIRSLLKYLFQKRMINSNIASLIDTPKIHEKPIVRLEVDEVANLLDQVESGDKLSKTQNKYHNKTSNRDLAIICLLLGTGIRVSECVGIDINDINFSDNSFKVTRKGGNQVILYFSDEIKEALLPYYNERKNVLPVTGSENAMFLSLQRKRITVRAVENLVKKYSKLISPLKNISPHKLRSTFGTNLYRETGDIYLVANMLGHKDVNTTRKHYAAIADEQRKTAARVVRLRD